MTGRLVAALAAPLLALAAAAPAGGFAEPRMEGAVVAAPAERACRPCPGDPGRRWCRQIEYQWVCAAGGTGEAPKGRTVTIVDPVPPETPEKPQHRPKPRPEKKPHRPKPRPEHPHKAKKEPRHDQ